MFENRIRETRIAKGLSVRQFAEVLGLSVQEALRIEVGVQAVRFDLLIKICAALNTRMAALFPSVALPLQRLTRARSPDTVSKTLEQFEEQLAEAGIDTAPAKWRIHAHLRGGSDHILPVSGLDMKRIRSILEEDAWKKFLIITSGENQIALNSTHLVVCQFLFDPPNIISEEDEGISVLQVHLRDRPDPIEFDIYPDSADFDDERASESSTQLQALFFEADTGLANRLSFEDVNGEKVFLIADDVSMISIPIWMICPRLNDVEEDQHEAR